MGYNAGWQALNMIMTGKVPRMELSAENHWALVKKVTGIDTGIHANRSAASVKFVKEWDYSFIWSTDTHKQHLERFGKTTNMGHSVYNELADGSSDRDDNVHALFTDVDEALKLDCYKAYGQFDQKELIKSFNAGYKDRCGLYPDAVNMNGVYITVISGLNYIYGWEMLLECIAYPEFEKVVESYSQWAMQFFEAFAKSDVPVLMVHDDMVWTSGKFASKEWYDRNVIKNIKKYMAPCKAAGKKIMFTSDGDYRELYDDIVRCGADVLVFEPGSDMEGFAKKYGKTHGFVGDVDTRVLLMGDKHDIEREVKRVMNFGKQYPGFVCSVSNHIPQNTPVDNALWYNEMYNKYAQR